MNVIINGINAGNCSLSTHIQFSEKDSTLLLSTDGFDFGRTLNQISTKDLIEEVNRRTTSYVVTRHSIEEFKIENKRLIEHNHSLVEMLNKYVEECSELTKKNFELTIDSIYK